jgi:hypothetical protein
MGFISDTLGSITGASSAADAMRAAAANIRFDPSDVTSGLGSVQFGEGRADISLDPRLQASSDRLFGQSGGFLEAAGGFDPTQFATERFSRAQSIVEPARQRAREALEARLLAQGRLGSTGGSLQTGEQERQFADADTAMSLEAERQAFQRQQQLQGLGLGALSAGLTVEQAPLALAQLGLGVGQGGLQAAQARGSLQSEAAQIVPSLMGGLLSGGVQGALTAGLVPGGFLRT